MRFDLQLFGAAKTPGRVIDGPTANWATGDENAKISLANNGTLKLGQPLCIDVTQLGPDQNVPNNAAALPQCEYLVATTSANAGPFFGVVSTVQGNPTGIKQSTVSGVPTWTNTSGSTLVVPITVRQLGFAYIYAGTAAIGQTGGNSILVGSTLITTSAQTFAIQGTAAIGSTIGTALATAINTTEQGIPAGAGQVVTAGLGAAAAAGVVSVVPGVIAGLVPNALVLIDSIASGVQETVSVGSISYPTFSIALANAHGGNFAVKGPNSNPTKNSVLISTPGAGVTIAGLVACWMSACQ